MRSLKSLSWLFVAAIIWFAFPLLAASLVGAVWIYQQGWLWPYIAATAVTTASGWWLAHATLARLRGEVAAAPPPAACWTPLAQQARQAVEAVAERLEAEDRAWGQPEDFVKAAMEVLDAVARCYYPKSDAPILERPLPHVFGAVELALRDVRRLVADEVPFGSSVTLKGWMRLKSLGQWAWPIVVGGYRGYRVARLANPLAGIAREGMDWASRRLAGHSLAKTKHWLIREATARIGDYAIQLYSGDLTFPDESCARLSPPTAVLDFAAEPLQTLVLGQVKAGKSSLVNALLGQPLAPVDALPATDRVDLYECVPAGLPPMILRDAPGYAGGDADGPDALSAMQESILECDLIVLVCSAQSASRKADCEMLRRIRALVGQTDRPPPPVVCVLTHIDCVPKGLVGEAVAAVAADLGRSPAEATPVCVRWGRLENVAGILNAIRGVSEEAERLKQMRCIRQIRRERDEHSLLTNLLRFGRLGLGWKDEG